MILSGVLTRERGGMLMIPRAEDYRRQDIVRPVLISLVGIMIAPDGGQIVQVSRLREYFDEALKVNPGTRLWIVEGMTVIEPVAWEDKDWLIQEAELFVLRWLRKRNDPEHLTFLWPWLINRNIRWQKRLGKEEFASQYRRFWGRDWVEGLP